ncbi:thyroid transcription factor 1-associated protein 26 homolog [Kryptolebias marmoratus]|uniref:Coiled-coil domain containing 59 n=1 Tax=Kryptolebias marmoratus TaxID=37003 RepID=A0A3Q3AZG8_KRYMA|nr:thyroid transcription factor 1-associated protein 26 homolog [Kryptolebias marmoratus]
MAPRGQKMKNKNFTEKSDNLKRAKQLPAGVKKKRKWIPDHKTFKGSVQEGQGFALKKKQKIKHEYNKLLRKERKKNPEHRVVYKEEYPEHLKHLYLAEAEKMRSEAWANRVNRSKLRIKGQLEEMDEDEDEDKATTAAAVGGDSSDDDDDDGTDFAGESKPTVSASGNPEPTTASERESLPISNRMKKKMHKKTSNQKTKEEFERNREKQRLKKEEYLKNKQQREEAMQRYKQKKMETFQMLSKKTKKGQPNLNLQMEYLLQKIQGANK